MGKYNYATIAAIRSAFWRAHPEFQAERRIGKRQNDYRCDIRVAFVDFVDNVCRDGQCSTRLGRRVTL